MPDIIDPNWSERDDRNAENTPDGWPPGLPAFVELVGRMMMGAIKRFWNKANPVYLTTGTADAYVVTPEANVAFINIFEVIRVRFDRANTTTTPTFQWGGASPRTIVKVLGTGVAPLAVGDLIAGKDHSIWYNGTNFVLSNPGTVTAAETSGLLKAANNLSDVQSGPTSLANIGGMAKATYDPQNINADAFARANQTGTQAQSTIVNLVSDLALKAPLASPALTGNPTAPTQPALNNSTRLATTAYTDGAVSTAIAGLPPIFPAATQAQQEAATSNAVAVTPGTQKFHPSAAKAFACVTQSAGTYNLQTTGSSGVSGITKNGVGDVTVTWSTPFSGSFYAVSVSPGQGGNFSVSIQAQTAGSVRLDMRNAATAAAVDVSFYVCAFGDI
jgi:hypothetical protein